MPVKLNQQGFLFCSQFPFAGFVDFIESIFRDFQHFHVGSKLFDQSLDDLPCRGGRAYADAFGGDLIVRPFIGGLVVESHNPVELEELKI